jgi:hypothetical protein
LKFNHYLKKLHGENYGLDESLALSLQFAEHIVRGAADTILVFHEEGEEGRRGEPNFAKQSIFLRP